MTLQAMMLSDQDCLFFEHEAEKRFVKKLKQNFQTHSSELIDLYGDEAVENTIHYGLKKAQMYGINHESGVSEYIGLTLSSLGCRFDEDPLYINVHSVLKNSSLSGYEKEDELIRYREAFFHSLFTPEKKYVLNLIKYIRNQEMYHFNPTSKENMIEQILTDSKSFFYAKYELFDENNLIKHIDDTFEDLEQFGLQKNENKATISIISFLFGFQFYNSTLYPEAKKLFYSDMLEKEKMVFFSKLIDNQLRKRISMISKNIV